MRRAAQPRGGHHPGHLRDEFIEALEEYLLRRAKTATRLVAACGAVWNCTDTVPNDYVLWAENIRGVTAKLRSYAALARAIRATLSHTTDRERPSATSHGRVGARRRRAPVRHSTRSSRMLQAPLRSPG